MHGRSLWNGGAWINSTHINHIMSITSNHDKAQYCTYSVHIGSDWVFFFIPTLGLGSHFPFRFRFRFPLCFLVLQSFFQHNISAAFGFSCKQARKRANSKLVFLIFLPFFLHSFFTTWRSGGGADCIYVSWTACRVDTSFRLDLALVCRFELSKLETEGGNSFGAKTGRQAGGLEHDMVDRFDLVWLEARFFDDDLDPLRE